MANLTWPMHVYSLEIKKLSSYRVDFWLRLVVAALVRILLAYYLWNAIFSSSGQTEIAGYTNQGMIFYYIVAAFVGNMVLAGIDRFSSEIYEGTLTRYLLYPVSFYLYQVTTGLAYVSLCALQLGFGVAVALLVLGGVPAGIDLSIGTVLLGILMATLAAYNYLIMQALLELMAFWVDAIWGLMVALYFIVNFLGGGLLPLGFFPDWAQLTLKYTPFPYLISFPVEVILGRLSAAQILEGVAISISWSAVLTYLAKVIWHRGLRRYTGVGI